MDHLIDAFVARGDLAHLALLAWALGASGFAYVLFRELAAGVRRFDDFVREIARFNASFNARFTADTKATFGDDE